MKASFLNPRIVYLLTYSYLYETLRYSRSLKIYNLLCIKINFMHVRLFICSLIRIFEMNLQDTFAR